ncbi:MAG: ATP-grasp domain-containing protein [Hafnia sp.]
MQQRAKFLIDRYVVENSYHDDLHEHLQAMGYEVVCEQYTPMLIEPPRQHFRDDDCVVLYGSLSFVEQFSRGREFIPGAYYTKNRYLCSQYLHRLPWDLLGNQDYVMVPFGELVRRRQQFYDMFNTNCLFIRPDSGFKTFTGLPLHEEDFDHEVNTLRQLRNITDDVMILVSSGKRIEGEYRFFVVGGEVITGSRYKLNDQLAIDSVIDGRCLEVAQAIAKGPWQVDLAYACDVGIVNGQPKVIELNAFSTSGLYAADIPKLFGAVSDIALAEWRGDVSLSN